MMELRNEHCVKRDGSQKTRKVLKKMKNDKINLDDYISTKEYAEMHGVSPATVRSHIMKGNIECIKFGRISLIERTYPTIVTGKQIGRASCRERVCRYV